MNTIDAYEKEIELELSFVQSFQKQTMIQTRKQPSVIFTGSGDSFVSAMLAESFSGNVVKSMDPLDLYKNRQLVDKKTVYFISISGNTISNIKTANITPQSIAITANPDSTLAKSCTGTIHLKFPKSNTFTAGSISFLSSMLTCISLVVDFDLWRPKQIFDKAKMAAKTTNISTRVFVLGDLHTYPLAMYCAAKFYEILGINVHYCRVEQFSHMELFSAKKGDTVIIFDNSTYGEHLATHLKSVGLDVYIPKFKSNNMLSRTLFFVFYSQLLPLFIARNIGQDDCYFVLAKKLRNVSNNMIY